MISDTFKYREPTESQIAAMNELREAYSEVERLILLRAPSSRLRAIALTELEQSAAMANKAITHAATGRGFASPVSGA